MGYTKRTTRSTGKGSRATNTKTVTNKGNTKHTASRSTGSKTTRITSSTNLNSGKPTKHYITTNVAGWRKTTLLNPTTRTKKPKAIKSSKRSRSKPIDIFGWITFILILILLANS